MSFFNGIVYNVRGLALGLRTPRLLWLGLTRFAITALISLVAGALILGRRDQLLELMWHRPEGWQLPFWYLLSWLLALVLVAMSAAVGFLLAQLLFGALIMDAMSQITEKLVTGRVRGAALPWYAQLIHLFGQEILRAMIPVTISGLLLVLSWLTPLGPVMTVLSSAAAVIFLAWDNTDLAPSRRMKSFRERWGLLRRTWSFHLGFGLWFLVPVLNVLFLSYAPVGATLFYVEKIEP